MPARKLISIGRFWSRATRSWPSKLENWAHAQRLREASRQRRRRSVPGTGSKTGRGRMAEVRDRRHSYGAASEAIDTRALCIFRETLARHSGLADFAFALQGLGSGAITLFGTPEQKQNYLPRVARGRGDRGVCAFRARRRLRRGGDAMRSARGRRRLRFERREDLDFEWRHRRFLRAVCAHRRSRRRAAGSRRLSSSPTRRVSKLRERLEVIAPHPLARLAFNNCRVPATQRIGRSRARLQSRDGDARCVSHFGGRRGAWALRGGRCTRRWDARLRGKCSGRRWPIFS